ncbi:hypothetical protein BGX28_002250 [Mortierella sp. GBA30]|nr:hypothetical protein BGX28_002250 [Mortierella sp. GBA30]
MSIILVSSDIQVFKVNRKVAECSILIKNKLEKVSEPINFPIILLLSKVTTPVLIKVIEYCEHHRNDHLRLIPYERSKGPRDCLNNNVIEQWDMEFTQKLDHKLLMNIAAAANDLDIRSLADIVIKAVANVIKTKTPQEIRALFYIVNTLRLRRRLR